LIGSIYGRRYLNDEYAKNGAGILRYRASTELYKS
jgi:hypothetical protein